MGYFWARGIQSQPNYQAGTIQLTAIANGQTYVRTRFRWGFYGDTAVLTNLNFVSTNLITFGLVTTIGDGTEHVPNPRSEAGNAAPPTRRWLYWETRGPIVSAIDNSANIVSWHDSGSTEPTDSRAMVLATGIPSGQSLNCWASWAAPFTWDPSGEANVWFGWEVLIKT